MKLSEIRKICEPKFDQERNTELCRQIQGIDEAFIYHVDRNILNHNCDISPVQNLDLALEELKNHNSISGRYLKYNTWPNGIPTREIYPRFLAICRGKKTLNDAFKKISEQSQKIASVYKNNGYNMKTVILLTDKWDVEKFRKYEKIF